MHRVGARSVRRASPSTDRSCQESRRHDCGPPEEVVHARVGKRTHRLADPGGIEKGKGPRTTVTVPILPVTSSASRVGGSMVPRTPRLRTTRPFSHRSPGIPISQLRNWSSRRNHCGRRTGSASSLAPQASARRSASAVVRPRAGTTASEPATSAASRRCASGSGPPVPAERCSRSWSAEARSPLAADHGDGAVGVVQQSLADGAEQQAGETTASPGSDDDQLGVAAGVQ